MPDIELVKPHSLTINKAKALVQETADGLAAEYDLNYEWCGNTLHFHRSGVDGLMCVTDSEIQLQLTLGFLLKPFKGKFIHHIERNFDRLLAEQEPTAQARKTKRKDSAGRGMSGEKKKDETGRVSDQSKARR
jgi:putative polyhydroxyalkanoate system protein